MVPPFLVTFFCSSMSEITGSLAFSFISVESACFNPRTFRPYSITAHCMPRHIHRKGMLFSRAYRMAVLFPYIPRLPNTGDTEIGRESVRERVKQQVWI